MPLLVRTWNLFHGNAKPPERQAFLDEMVRLATADGPDIVCFQEVPAWSLERLDDWSGMVAIGDVAQRPRLGPFPSTAEIGRILTSLHHGRLRSSFAGQANAILVSPEFRVVDRDTLVLNAWHFRRAQSRWLELDLLARTAWRHERRVCQAVRLALPDGRAALVGNLHATSFAHDQRLADAELLRAACFLDGLAAPDDVVLFCGDFNVNARRSRTLSDLAGGDWGFSEPGDGIDHILVRGARASRPQAWPPDRRRVDGRLLSDHALVEARVE